MTDDDDSLAAFFRDVSLGAPENAVGFVMWRVVHRYLRRLDRALEPHGLTHLQFMTLILAAWQARSGEPATQAQLARAASIHPMQVSLMLKTLEAKGLVDRPRGPADVRTKRVAITPAGLAALRGALPVVMDVQRRFFGEQGAPGGPLLATLLALEADEG